MFASLQPIDVYAAAKRLRPVIRRTSLRRSETLSRRLRGDIYLKLETEQHTGSFKLRGAYNAIACLSAEERARGVVTSSAGNHGQGIAYAAQAFGIPAVIFVPSTAPRVKLEGMRRMGATVDADAPDYDEAMRRAKTFAAREGLAFINPCLGADVLAGQGTVALEILEDLPEVATIVTPVGGGGLLGGIGSLIRRVAPHVRIVGAQSVRTAAMAQSLRAGRVVPIPSVPTLADGLAGAIDEEALDIGREVLDDIQTVEEDEIAGAIAWLAHEEDVIVEGSGAVPIALMLRGDGPAIDSPAVAILTGGNIDREIWEPIRDGHPR